MDGDTGIFGESTVLREGAFKREGAVGASQHRRQVRSRDEREIALTDVSSSIREPPTNLKCRKYGGINPPRSNHRSTDS